MNYIRHLNSVFELFAKDSRLNPTHISTYIALFQLWNINRFIDTFYINREEVMRIAKIGSKNTYHRCLKELDHWKYIRYLPSHNPYKGSRVHMLNFDITTGTSSKTTNGSSSDQVAVQALVPYININKLNKNINKHKLPKNVNEVLIFFKKEKWPANEGRKFYNHYTSIGWKLGGKIAIENWYSSAKNWMLKADEINEEKTSNRLSQKRDNLKITKNKDYGQPL
ncbi:MAG: hypothetical protein R3243_15055 [Arenibacter latericius]|nr:hypothetical protein [Arenibacter latericius]